MKRLHLIIPFVLAVATAVAAQLTIDATGPARERKRQPTIGGGGGIGRKLPLRVTIELQGATDAEGKTTVAFTLTNLGRESLDIPVSVNPGDLEPHDPHVTYTDKVLGLSISSFQQQKREFLPGGAVLVGSPAFPGTLVPLGPGESLRVITKVLLPRNPSAGTSFVAYATLDNETVATRGDAVSSRMDNIGYATSPPYTPRELLGAAMTD